MKALVSLETGQLCQGQWSHYAVVSWSPWTVEDKEVLERVQMRVVSNLRGRTYEARLGEVGMTSFEDRWVRGNMITTDRTLDPGKFFDLVADGLGPRTREVMGVYNLRKHSFSQRVVNT